MLVKAALNYCMDEEIDQLKAIKADERVNLATNVVFLSGLDEARAHQRGENVGRKVRGPKPAVGPHPKPRAKITPELKADILATPGTLRELAKKFLLSETIICRIRNGHR